MGLSKDNQNAASTIPLDNATSAPHKLFGVEASGIAATLQTPWGTDIARGAIQSSNRQLWSDTTGQRSALAAGEASGIPAAGMPAAGMRSDPRSSSVPSGSCCSRGASGGRDYNNGGHHGLGRIGSSSSARRFASPLSHAGNVLIR